MSQKIKNISIAMGPEMKEMVDLAAIKLKTSTSDIVRKLISRYLDLIVNDSEETPVILRIPADKKADPQLLREWLQVKIDAITKALTAK